MQRCLAGWIQARLKYLGYKVYVGNTRGLTTLLHIGNQTPIRSPAYPTDLLLRRHCFDVEGMKAIFK